MRSAAFLQTVAFPGRKRRGEAQSEAREHCWHWKDYARKSGLAAWSALCGGLEHREREVFDGVESSPPPSFHRSLRVALVKQTTYSDLYSDPSALGPRELLESSWHRTGPIGLFLHFQARFFIVHPESDPECRVAEEKFSYAATDPARARDDSHRRTVQTRVAVRAAEVNWSDFDLVIAIENAVPARVTKKHPRVLWATLLEHHRMAPYGYYLKRAPEGYDAFLNLRYGPNPRSLLRQAHVVDWPYNFNVPEGLARLYPEVAKENRSMLEDHQSTEVKEAFAARRISWTGGEVTAQTLPRFLKAMVQAKVFCAVHPTRPLGGLALIDAVAAGCVVMADRSCIWNPYLVTPETNLRNAGQAVELADRLMADEIFFARVHAEQSRRLAWFCCERPLRQIADLLRAIPRTLSARGHLADQPSAKVSA